jgi:hypothetical protein
MAKASPVNVLCIYRLKDGAKEAEVKKLLDKHWPTLHKVGLATDEKAKVWRSSCKDPKQTIYIETFQWKDEKAPGIAHQTPEVMAVWEPLGALMQGMEFLHVEPVNIGSK